MGTDNGFEDPIKGAKLFLKDYPDTFISFVGLEKAIKPFISQQNIADQRYAIINAEQEILQKDSPLSVRRKKQSSMTKALETMAQGGYDAVLSGGSSAAYITGCHLICKELPGVERPAYLSFVPSFKGFNQHFLMLDVGANLINTPENLLQYAVIATTYLNQVEKKYKPTVGLLNVGTEPSKGHEYQKAAFKLMTAAKNINFVGNIEPRNLLAGTVDVVVADGYTGNLVLKTMEGTAVNLFRFFKGTINKSWIRKLAVLPLVPILLKVKKRFNYKNHASALVMGAAKLAVKTHGSSDAQSFYSALELCYRAAQSDVINKMEDALKIT